MRFAGKIAVVTGAASGIGKATVLKLAGEGAHVFAADIDEAGGRALAEQSNGKISFVRCDVTLPADIEALMDAAAAKAGGIDIVFNNAARSEEHTSELQSLMRISYAVFCLKKKNKKTT